MIQEVILCKYGEVILKGGNRSFFETALVRELRRRATRHGQFSVSFRQSTIYIEPQNDDCDIDGMVRDARRVFGIVGVSRAAVCEKSMESILKVAAAYLPDKLMGVRTFKVDAKRSDKAFPLSSPQISKTLGAAILSMQPRLRVDVHDPQLTVTVEVRELSAYIRAGQESGAGGLPPRTAGRGLLLLSGGIDSPVAGCMMAKRGMEVEALHFESYPYTSERAKEKVLTLARKMCEFTSRMYVHVISLTHIQEQLREKCQEDYFTLLLRLFMMKLAARCAKDHKCDALITGESLGQVASQTLKAIAVTDSVVDMPVFRPCIGLDKNEIVIQARHYDTFETSILPYEDCCTVFTPRHPRTQPKLSEVMREWEKVDHEALLEEAYATLQTVSLDAFGGAS